MTSAKRHVVVLGSNFAGLTVARLLRKYAGDKIDITVIDRKDYVLFIPNIPIEIFANNNPEETLHFPFVKHLERDGTEFIQGEVVGIDVDEQTVAYRPTERAGSATHTLDYDDVVIALGTRLSYDHIDGFEEHGHALSDGYYADELRKYLHDGDYKGGPIAIGSARFEQGHSPHLPDWFPTAEAACEGPPVEVALSLAAWLEDHDMGGPENITVFTPAELIAEDVGEYLAHQLLEMMGEMGFNYKAGVQDIERLTADGIEFANGEQIEAELKIVFPDWEPHGFLKSLPVVDDVGFVVSDLRMRNPDYPNVWTCGDAAALTVPKLGSLGHSQAEIISREIAYEEGAIDEDERADDFWPEVICMGDFGRNKAFYIHSDVWYGGDKEILKIGRIPYWMKLGFKEAYVASGGKVPSWGVPMTEFLLE
ncbi:MAG: NAD(P)/FAD-dependent oxidoreductase [Persicimonas sp.]